MEENIDKTMDSTNRTSPSPSEEGTSVKKRGRGRPIKHRLPCAVLVKRKSEVPTQALHECKQKKRKKDNTEGKEGGNKTSMEQPLLPISNENMPLKKRKISIPSEEEPKLKKEVKTENPSMDAYVEPMEEDEEQLRREAEMNIRVTRGMVETMPSLHEVLEIKDEVQYGEDEQLEQEQVKDPAAGQDPSQIVDVMVEELDEMAVKREVTVTLEPRSPTHEEVSSSTIPDSAPNQSIFPRDLKNKVRTVFTPQLESGLKMRLKIARPTPYLQIRRDLIVTTTSTTPSATTTTIQTITPLLQALVTAPPTPTPTPSTITSTLATLTPMEGLTRMIGPRGEDWGYARKLTPLTPVSPAALLPTVPQEGEQYIPQDLARKYTYPCLTRGTPTIANTEQISTHSQTQPQSVASTSTTYEPPQLVVIPPNTTLIPPNTTVRRTNASPPIRAHDRNMQGLKCKKLENHCKDPQCLMKGIFAHTKEKSESFRRYLKQVNFLFTRIMTRRILNNMWQCQWCGHKPVMTKKKALLHMKTNHGNLLKKTDDPREITHWIKGLEAKVNRRNNNTEPNNYPCLATNCDFVSKDPRTTHMHQIVSHKRSVKDKNCYLCDTVLGEQSTEYHWRHAHTGLTCKVNKCGTVLYSEALYWSHLNDVHHDYMESFLLPTIMTQLHDKLTQGDLIDGFHKMKPVLKAEKQNEKMPPMMTSAFRELMLNPPKDKTSFENIIIKYIPSSFVSQDDPYTPTIHRAIHGFLASYTKSSQTPPKNPVNAEITWAAQAKHAFGGFQNGYCVKCRDTVAHEPNDPKCFIRANHMSAIEYFFVYESTQHMKLFDTTLIRHEHECWGTTPIMPKDSATNKNLNLINLSEKRSEARYLTGTAHGVPVLLKRGYDPKPVVVSYFTHAHRMLARLQDQVVEPVFLEFFASFESTDPEDYNNMSLGWLKEFLKLKQRFDYFYIILTPYPKYKNLNTIGMFIEEMTRMRLLNNIFACYAAKLKLCILPTEGILYSVPQDESHSRWIWCPERDEPLRNNNSSGSRELHRRAGLLVDIAIRNYRTLKNYNDRGRRKLARWQGTPMEPKEDDDASSAEIDTDYSETEEEQTLGQAKQTEPSDSGYEIGF
jgi:hypothetical protein